MSTKYIYSSVLFKYKHFCRLWPDFNKSLYGKLAFHFQFEHFSEENALSIIKTLVLFFSGKLVFFPQKNKNCERNDDLNFEFKNLFKFYINIAV